MASTTIKLRMETRFAIAWLTGMRWMAPLLYPLLGHDRLMAVGLWGAERLLFIKVGNGHWRRFKE
jgi:hypothetical protein